MNPILSRNHWVLLQFFSLKVILIEAKNRYVEERPWVEIKGSIRINPNRGYSLLHLAKLITYKF
jgi:hypothetical protein